MVDSFRITTRFLAAAIAAFTILILVACGPAAPDSEMGAAPTTNTQGSAVGGQVGPTGTASAVAEPTAEPASSSDEVLGEISATPAEPDASAGATLSF